MTTLARLANLAWIAANSDGHKRYHAALADPEAAQRELLLGLVRRNAGTAFGKLHGFSSIKRVEDFQERVPLATWEDVEPWVDRIAAGETNVLTKARVRILEPSSGSSAAAKRIPYTADLQRDIRHAVAPWICDTYQRRPWLSHGPGYWSITPPVLEDARAQTPQKPSQIPIGFEEDGEYLGGFWKRLAGATLSVPGAIRLVHDIEAFRYITLLFLLRRSDLALLSVWHPSFLTLLLGALPRFWDSLVRDLERGTLNPPTTLSPAARNALAKLLSPLPERAAEIRNIGPLTPGLLWPQVALISCWGDAHAAIHLPEIQRLFPAAEVQPKGLIATEAFVTIPYSGRHPLAIRSHFFEFLPDGEEDRPRLAHELETGDVASVVVTTGGGLYRYRLQDRVAVDGFVGPTPSLRFLGKEGHVSDLSGEKLHESFVAGALARTFESLRIVPRFALLAPGDGSDGSEHPGYVLYVELAEPLPPGADLAATLDAELSANPHYRLCVSLGQLAPARIFRIEKDGVARYLEHRRVHGQRLGDVKPLALATETGWSCVFQ